MCFRSLLYNTFILITRQGITEFDLNLKLVLPAGFSQLHTSLSPPDCRGQQRWLMLFCPWILKLISDLKKNPKTFHTDYLHLSVGRPWTTSIYHSRTPGDPELNAATLATMLMLLAADRSFQRLKQCFGNKPGFCICMLIFHWANQIFCLVLIWSQFVFVQFWKFRTTWNQIFRLSFSSSSARQRLAVCLSVCLSSMESS